jgi:membrane protease YdiL (CAAX protease family)
MVAVFGAVLGPVTEELYFRGHLLPAMKYAGKWAPLLHSFLFGMYHIWTPWMFITRTIGMIPLIYAVQRKNLFIGIIVHILINFVDVIAGIIFIMNMSSNA